ncbi:MAG: hypothetical protein AAF513_00925 [Pseudomonadota bacterium]
MPLPRLITTASVCLIAATTAIGGCAAKSSGPCATEKCSKDLVIRAVSRQCLSDLNDHHMLSVSERERINNTYRYPFTNEKTYSSAMRRGNMGPSPMAWCRRYAEWRAGNFSRAAS